MAVSAMHMRCMATRWMMRSIEVRGNGGMIEMTACEPRVPTTVGTTALTRTLLIPRLALRLRWRMRRHRKL